MNDVLGEALLDYNSGKRNHKLWIYNNYGRREEMPVRIYFRSVDTMSDLELLALEACTGNILDVGAAAGCHSLTLQHRNYSVTALDVSKKACSVMLARGIRKVVTANIFSFKGRKFSTILLLMNGIGVAGTLQGLGRLLKHLQQLLKPGGQIIFDSSDVLYLYTNQPQPQPQHYYGEIDYRYVYKEHSSRWFTWLYIDKQNMQSIALACGLRLSVLAEDEAGQYLGRLTAY